MGAKFKRAKIREDICAIQLLDSQELFDIAIVLFDKKWRVKESVEVTNQVTRQITTTKKYDDQVCAFLEDLKKHWTTENKNC